mmetsp:Transcript_13544/g.37409  ORF Transcript_13544/g.37409 Transcript_13544/m.37409 type:complete len:498 (+) Transcript_13544:267-1760(+)|eukprot:CAMPEP_0168727290 /NCGR_PEP_ID=MMETSP0724-20121128/5103_1 /TAXON_ID=265536 /ORGANISM="Amphiprora sp., Strain CCMP467" /LENGTH=497 /DNA_ID=CAMNT_0008774121 /DNA_START=219 /DNA_END=1712 /DNA_ORIENTATION=-
MGLSTEAIILEWVCPICGTVLTNIMFFSPFMDVLRATSETGSLGDLNPTPWAFMLANCLGWISYSFVITNYYAFFANAPALLLSLWLNFSAVKLQYENSKTDELKKSLLKSLHELEDSHNFDAPYGGGDSTSHSSSGNQQTNMAILRRSIISTMDSSQLSLERSRSSQAGSWAERNNSRLQQQHAQSHSSLPPGSRSVRRSIRASFMGVLGASTVSQETEEDRAKKRQKRRADYGRLIRQVTSNHNEPASSPHERLLIFLVFCWLGIIALVVFGDDRFDQTVRELIVGSCANATTLFFYGAPLSTIFRVLRTRNAVSIHFWTMVMNTLTSFFWAAYGAAIRDLFITLPNVIGVALGVVQIFLWVVFPKKSRGEDHEDDSESPSTMEFRPGRQPLDVDGSLLPRHRDEKKFNEEERLDLSDPVKAAAYVKDWDAERSPSRSRQPPTSTILAEAGAIIEEGESDLSRHSSPNEVLSLARNRSQEEDVIENGHTPEYAAI